MLNVYTADQYRRDSIYLVRKLAREISTHRNDPVELGLDLEEMQHHGAEHPDPFIRALSVRYLTRHQFGPSRDPRRTAA